MSKIILLHGLHMHSWVMKPLADMLAKQGFDVALFGYYSVWHTMQQHTQALAEFVEKHETGEPLHFAGHSLGGLVLRHFAAAHPEKSPAASLPSVRRIKAVGRRKGYSGSD